jgi:Tfp pilus assembly protein PilN
MFTIDLLNGQAIPPKTTPGGLAILAVTAVVPIVVAAGLVVMYLNNGEALSIKEKEVAEYEMEISAHAGAVKLKNALVKEKQAYGKYLSEVKSSISKHTQWSPVLTTLMQNIPDSVILTSLAIEHESIRKSVPAKDDPTRKVEISVPVRILRLGVSGGDQGDCDQAVKDFMGRLWASASLGPKIENIGHSQESAQVDGGDVISYEISCFFKPGL